VNIFSGKYKNLIAVLAVFALILITGIFSDMYRDKDKHTVQDGIDIAQAASQEGQTLPETDGGYVSEPIIETCGEGAAISDGGDINGSTSDVPAGSDPENNSGIEANADPDNNDINNDPDPEEETDLSQEEVISDEIPEEKPTDVESLLASMTLHEKVCQMIIVSTTTLTGERKLTTAGTSVQTALALYPVGGIIYDSSNFSNRNQTITMLQTTQGYSQIPLIMTLDEEGGRVARLMNSLGTTRIGPMLDYKDLGPEMAMANASVIASDIKSFGFNLDLAPVADVWSNPQNTVIGDRAYSDDYFQAATLVSGAVLGFHSQGIACTLKHFPGHGDSSADSHYGAVYVYKSMDQIRREELVPFAAGIGAGADCVMIGHLIVSEMGDEPALFNGNLIRGVLRNEMGFNGIIMTDSLQMKAMTDFYGVSEIPVRAVQAGCDVLLMPSDLPATVAALENAVNNGTISEARINESVRRILNLKYKYGILQF
jgi:beta-N-acetylhexosaminidase